MSGKMAEREGFEPPIPFQVCPLSRRIVSTTHAPLRAVKIVVWRYFSRCCREEASGAKAPKALYALRGPKGPLFHGGANSTHRPSTVVRTALIVRAGEGACGPPLIPGAGEGIQQKAIIPAGGPQWGRPSSPGLRARSRRAWR